MQASASGMCECAAMLLVVQVSLRSRLSGPADNFYEEKILKKISGETRSSPTLEVITILYTKIVKTHLQYNGLCTILKV